MNKAQLFSETYSYKGKDGTLKQMTMGGDTLIFDYDVLKRFDTRTSPVMTVDYDYRSSSTGSNKTTTQVSQIKYTDAAGTEDIIPALGYTYDALGNITKVTSGSSVKQAYTYDAQNQLKAETIFGYKGGTLYGTYTYDTYGNIRSIKNSLSGVEEESYTLEYGNSTWLDRLTKVTYTDKDGNVSSGTLSYDQIGNPEEYFNGHDSWNFTWKFGRQLTNATNGTNVVSYAYDVDGIRQSKIVDGREYKYTMLDGKVVRETFGGIIVDYFYDNGGKPYKLVVDNGSAAHVGYYVLNQQGDVIAILDETGGVAVTYEYNAWGKILDETGSGTLVSLYLQSYNHLKYRGYYYDTETGFYYLENRYYDPVIGRFINADGYVSTGTTHLGYNMYAYCLNNLVNMVDTSGNDPEWLLDAAEEYGTIACAAKFAGEYRRKPTSDVGSAKPYVKQQGSKNRNSPNCYAYAINSPVNEQPGGRSGNIPAKWNDVYDVGQSVEADMKSRGNSIRVIDGPNAKVYANEYKIALRVGTKPCGYDVVTGELFYDYHFMRQTNTGQWAEKHGIGGDSILWDVGMTPDTIPWTLDGMPYYDSDIIYYAIGE